MTFSFQQGDDSHRKNEKFLSSEFEMDLGELTFFFGIQVMVKTHEKPKEKNYYFQPI
jgi:hypothetical protein